MTALASLRRTLQGRSADRAKADAAFEESEKPRRERDEAAAREAEARAALEAAEAELTQAEAERIDVDRFLTKWGSRRAKYMTMADELNQLEDDIDWTVFNAQHVEVNRTKCALRDFAEHIAAQQDRHTQLTADIKRLKGSCQRRMAGATGALNASGAYDGKVGTAERRTTRPRRRKRIVQKRNDPRTYQSRVVSSIILAKGRETLPAQNDDRLSRHPLDRFLASLRKKCNLLVPTLYLPSDYTDPWHA